MVKTHYNLKNENHHMGVFDCSNETSGCTDYNAKNLKLDFFFKNVCFWWFFLISFSNGTVLRVGFFLRCNQCIHTLHLNYQTPPYDGFIFLGYNQFLQFLRPLVPGVKRKI